MSNVMPFPAQPVSDQARRFAEEYCIDFKVARAAERAGISAAAAHGLMYDPRIQALINERKRIASDRVNVSIDSVLDGFRAFRDVNVDDYFTEEQLAPGVIRRNLKPMSEWTDDMRAALKSLKHTAHGVVIEVHDKNAALVNIGKYLGMFVDQVKLTPGSSLPTLEQIAPTMTPQQAAEAYQKTIDATKGK